MTQTAAFQRLELISKSQGAIGNIRKEIFSDDSGKRWQLVANACLNQVYLSNYAKILFFSLHFNFMIPRCALKRQ